MGFVNYGEEVLKLKVYALNLDGEVKKRNKEDER